MKPVIGITMGDPASIGPEITVKALKNFYLYEKCKPVVVGDADVIEKAKYITGNQKMQIHRITSPEDGLYIPGCIDVIDMGLVKANELKYGEISPEAGNAAFNYVKKVIELAMSKQIDATVTNALNKEAINIAGHHYSGHTEIYAKYTGTRDYTMMLVYKGLRVVHVSTHVSLKEACNRVKKNRVLEVIRIANKACCSMGIAIPKIGVAGLNPGENGLFGREEIEEILPAIYDARLEGIQVEGAIPPDSIFPKALGGWYDVVVAMYHDQGHIPLKTIGFVYDAKEKKWSSVEGVNITLGLPIIRTSVDHGTAFDQVGTGEASELSLVNAIDYAVNFAKGHK